MKQSNVYRTFSLALLILGLNSTALSAPWDNGPLVSKGHFLYNLNSGTGKYTPFFFLADTAWTLNQFSDSEIQTWLSTRSSQGFTALQVAPARGWGHPFEKDAAGNMPFAGGTPTQFNTAYWNRWRWIADRAKEKGLYLVFHLGGVGRADSAYQCSTNQVCYEFGRKVGAYFRDKANIIYNIGLDEKPDYSGSIGVAGYRAIAEGVADGKSGSGSFDLAAAHSTSWMSFHPGTNQGSSALWFHNDAWLDSNGFQTGSSGMASVYSATTSDYKRTPVEPTVLIEGAYEDCPLNRCTNHVVGPLDQRRQAWQTYLAGAAGFGYGVHCHWVASSNSNSKCPTDFARDLSTKLGKAAKSVGPLAKFFKSKPFDTFKPDQGIIASNVRSGVQRRVATSRSDKKEFYVYFPETASGASSIRMNRISSGSGVVVAQWWNPATDPITGTKQAAGEHLTTSTPSLKPPAWPDAVLIVRAK